VIVEILRCNKNSTLTLLCGVILAFPTLILWADGTNISNLFPPGSNPYGSTLGEWAGKWWQWFLSTPTAADSESMREDESASRCATNQGGPVWFLEGVSGGAVKYVCTVPAEKAILIPLLIGACSYADTPNARTDQELRSCAMSGNEGALIELTIDGVKLEDINTYRVQSQPFALAIPEENPLGISAGPTTAVADCWCVMLEPLTVGRHIIQQTVSIPGNPTVGISAFAADVTYDLIIQEQQSTLITPYTISVPSSGDEIVIPINSSSNVTDFRFNEERKQLSLTVTSKDNTGGIVMLPISRALEGPYTVTFNGNIISTYEIINNETSNETNIKINYDQGIHDISITGTNVIPEFSSSIAGILVLGVVSGMIMLLKRLGYVTGYLSK
jgi:hypothetical protein